MAEPSRPDPAASTVEDFWRLLHGEQARWRTSHTLQWCANRGFPFDSPHRCPAGSGVRVIEPGDRYFDTGEAVGQWRTLHLCAACARRTT
jgi:hypothetical protein